MNATDIDDADFRAALQAVVSTVSTISFLAAISILLLPLVASGPVHSFQYVIIAVLASFNSLESLFYLPGPALVPFQDADAPSGGCVFQGVMLQFASMAAFVWILVFCGLVFTTARAGSSNVLMTQPTARMVALPLLVAVGFSVVTCCALSGHYGGATLWCWVTDPTMGLYLYYLPLSCIWLLSIASVGYAMRMVGLRVHAVRREVQQRFRSLVLVHRAAEAAERPEGSIAENEREAREQASTLLAVQRSAVTQLSAYLVVFIFFSTFGLANRLAQLANPAGSSPRWLTMLQAVTMPLQGLANGVVFSRWVHEHWRPHPRWRRIYQRRARGGLAALSEACQSMPLQNPPTHDPPTHDPPARRGAAEPPHATSTCTYPAANPAAGGSATASAGSCTGDAPPAWLMAPPAAAAFDAKVFATTWNLGEVEPPADAVEQLSAWLPVGCDIYLIGLQECLKPHEWQRAITTALSRQRGGQPRPGNGGRGAHSDGGAYELVAERMIGSAQTALGYHGYIVLLAYASTAHAGAFTEVQSGKANVNRGASIGGVARAANKGAVGVAFRFHSLTLAVVSCHLAADKRGKMNVDKRLKDTRKLLEAMELEIDAFAADLQSSCHHTILMGDLNFRVLLSAASAVGHISSGQLAPLLTACELREALSRGEVLHRFREPPITFLPTFRRVAGAAGGMSDAELTAVADGTLLSSGLLSPPRLSQLYTLHAKDGTERTPSYTDRVLIHSLPGTRAWAWACCMLHVAWACCMLHVACCMLHVAWAWAWAWACCTLLQSSSMQLHTCLPATWPPPPHHIIPAATVTPTTRMPPPTDTTGAFT